MRQTHVSSRPTFPAGLAIARSGPRRATLLLLVVACAAGIGCGGAEDPVRIGAVVPQSGSASGYGVSVERGMALAADELRSAHQRGEYPIALELDLRDSASQPERAARALEELFDSGAAVAVGGVTPAEADAMARVAEREERVLVSPTARAATPRAVDEAAAPSRYVFRLFPSLHREGNKLASFAALELHLTRSAVVSPAGEGTAADSFVREFERNRGRVVSRIDYRDPEAESARIAKDVIASKAQAVLVAGAGEPIAAIIAGLDARGYRGAVLTTSGFAEPRIVESAGRRAEGVLLARPVFDRASARPAVRAFVAAFEQRYGEQPDLWAAYGYDSVRVLATALAKARSPRDAWSGLRGLTEYEGVTGPIQFDEGGDAAAFPRVYVVSRGEMKELAGMKEPERRELYRRFAATSTGRMPSRVQS